VVTHGVYPATKPATDRPRLLATPPPLETLALRTISTVFFWFRGGTWCLQNADFLDGPFDAVFETRQEQIVTPKIWAPLLSTRKKTLTGIFATVIALPEKI